MSQVGVSGRQYHLLTAMSVSYAYCSLANDDDDAVLNLNRKSINQSINQSINFKETETHKLKRLIKKCTFLPHDAMLARLFVVVRMSVRLSITLVNCVKTANLYGLVV